MTDTSAVATPLSGRPGRWARLRFRWQAEQELHELTRNRALEQRVLAEAAVRLQPGPWAIGLLFRRDRDADQGVPR